MNIDDLNQKKYDEILENARKLQFEDFKNWVIEKIKEMEQKINDNKNK